MSIARRQQGPRRTVAFAVAANVCIAILKFVAAAITGSSAMLSEGIHSLVDTGDGVLLFVGMRRAQLPPDELHPFGHGKEIYFWTLVVAILVFAVGGGMSIYEGILHVAHQRAIESHAWSYAVLAGSALFEGTSWAVAWRHVRRQGRRGRSVWERVETTKDPTPFAVLFEDSAALAGLATAFVGVSLGQALRSHLPDAIASMIIGVILMITATVLARATLRLLIGQSADPEVLDGIGAIAGATPAVRRVGGVLAVHYGPHDIVAHVDVSFDPRLRAEELAGVVDDLQRRLKGRFPDLRSISVEAQTEGGS